MAGKVVKLIVLVDDETADRFESIMEVEPKARGIGEEDLKFTDADGSVHGMHFIFAEVV